MEISIMANDSIKTTVVRIYPDGRMDTTNASWYTGYAAKTLAMMRCKGIGPKYIKRGKIFYYQSDVDEWMQSGKVSTAQNGNNQEAI